MEWAVATQPEIFPEIPGTNLRLVKTAPFPGAPPLRVYFTIDNDDDCTLRWIEVIEAPAEQEDFSE